MATIQNPPPTQTESKSAKKKKAKGESVAPAAAPHAESDAAGERRPSDGAINGGDGSNESPYLKELSKNIRNIKKKLNATQKVDSIVAENPGISLDDLLAAKKINQDQKAQAQKKPSLQTSLAQLEEQAAQYKQFDEDYQKRLSAEKAALASSHKEELQRVKDAAFAEAAAENKKEAKDNLLVLSKFLRAAAAKRQGGDENSGENRAFEGALLLVYGGEVSAVVAMESLIAGSEEIVPTVDGAPSGFTYKQVRDSASEYAPYAAEEAWVDEVAQAESGPPTGTDPTVAHAGLTEIDHPAEPATNGFSSSLNTPGVPEASNIDAGAANAAAETSWEAKQPGSGEEEWIQVTRDPAETDTGNTATPAGMNNTQSWADQVDSTQPPSIIGVGADVVESTVQEFEVVADIGAIEAKVGVVVVEAFGETDVAEMAKGVDAAVEGTEAAIVDVATERNDKASWGLFCTILTQPPSFGLQKVLDLIHKAVYPET
ncbi:hypothetical protein MMC21_003933 [Puttea exsequens]|nr:hypothetical protein [Puttea exsequens]